MSQNTTLSLIQRTQKKMMAAYENTNPSQTDPKVDETQITPTPQSTNIHGKKKAPSKQVRSYITYALYGTPSEIQSNNPIVRNDAGQLVFKSGVSDRNESSSPFKQLFDSKLLNKCDDRFVDIQSVEVEGVINNTPFPVSFQLSGLKSGPSFAIKHSTYDGLMEEISRSFDSAFSPSPALRLSNDDTRNPKLDLIYAKPAKEIFTHGEKDHSKASPVHLKTHAYAGPFGIASGSTHCEDPARADGASPSPSSVHEQHVGLVSCDDPNMTFDTIISSYFEDGEHKVLVPYGSPLHVAFSEGHVREVLLKTQSMLVGILQSSGSFTKASATKLVRRAQLASKVSKKSKKESKRDLSVVGQPVTTPILSENRMEYDAERLLELLVGLKETEDEKADGRSAKLQEWIDRINANGTTPNLQNLLLDPIWSSSNVSIASSRNWTGVSLVTLPNNAVQLYLLTLFKVVGSKAHLRNVAGCLVRLDSPHDWAAQGRLTEAQHSSIQDKPFDIEVKLCVTMRVEKILKGNPKIDSNDAKTGTGEDEYQSSEDNEGDDEYVSDSANESSYSEYDSSQEDSD